MATATTQRHRCRRRQLPARALSSTRRLSSTEETEKPGFYAGLFSFRDLIDRLHHPRWRETIMLVATELAASNLSQDFSRGRQRRALDVKLGVPELGAHQRLGALE